LKQTASILANVAVFSYSRVGRFVIISGINSFSTKQGGKGMPKYVIEREIPGVGDWSAEQLKAASQTSCDVLNEMGPKIEWLHSFVTADKIYCVYNAANEDMIREHAKRGGFPANSVAEVKTMIDPSTAQG
jgi:hypothetical protein